MPNQNRRFDADFLAAKEVVESGKLGDLVRLEGRHRINTAPAPEDRWGTLVYMNENGEKVEEKVPVGCAHYERVYDNLVAAIEQGAEKVIKDAEVVRVLEILEEATAVAKSHAN